MMLIGWEKKKQFLWRKWKRGSVCHYQWC